MSSFITRGDYVVLFNQSDSHQSYIFEMSLPRFEKSYNYMCSYPDLESLDQTPSLIHNELFDSFMPLDSSASNNRINLNLLLRISKVLMILWFVICMILFITSLAIQGRCIHCDVDSNLSSLMICAFISAGLFVLFGISYFSFRYYKK
eukprot:NODE_329_length_9526_cov_0.701708.p7 type:complete len:148 gc:universal NODE_329_length_9526_cov_0.701708:8984-9427(+)